MPARGPRADCTRVESIHCDDLAATAAASRLAPRAAGAVAVNHPADGGDPEIVTAVSDAANNGTFTLAPGTYQLEVVCKARTDGSDSRAPIFTLKRWRDGTDQANDPVVAGDTAAIRADAAATWVRIGPSMGFWLDETAELYMETDEPSSGTATLELRNVYVRLYRW